MKYQKYLRSIGLLVRYGKQGKGLKFTFNRRMKAESFRRAVTNTYRGQVKTRIMYPAANAFSVVWIEKK